MGIILEPRIPKGGSSSGGGKGGKGFKGGSSGGAGGIPLPLWAELVIVFSVIWVCIYLSLFFYFFRQDHLRAAPSKRRRLGLGLFGRLAWKAFRYATLIQVGVWAVRKLIARCRTGRGTKKVGASFYRKLDEQEKGVNEASEPVGIPPAQLRREPLVSPVSISSPGGR
ncbi:hypothetical protein F5Y05DRAFT_337073 [Hypoxylon sp. FL0543]|nr:hypothetical protein F5Y05DRAFT_337073 [Hypoxylon sp. FL0543]